MTTLRLLLFEECNRHCPGCCNKDWDLKALPKVTDPAEYAKYDEVLLTGGEPMLHVDIVLDTVKKIREHSKARIYMYTAEIEDYMAALTVLRRVDGITVTLHDQADVPAFQLFSKLIRRPDKSMRLNVFEGIDVSAYPEWQVKRGMVWMKNCPLPPNEVFKRL